MGFMMGKWYFYEVWRYFLEVLFFIDEVDFELVLLELELFVQLVQCVLLDDLGVVKGVDVDVVIIDVCVDLVVVCWVCCWLMISVLVFVVVVVVVLVNFVVVDGDWIFDDVLLNVVGGVELQVWLWLVIIC